MIINYNCKYTDFKLFFVKKNIKLIHIFAQEINNKNIHGKSHLEIGNQTLFWGK